MRRVVAVLALALILGACTPRAGITNPEIAYQASRDEIFDVVVRSIESAPPVQEGLRAFFQSSNWFLGTVDRASGIVTAEATTSVGLLAINVLITPLDEGAASVLMTGSTPGEGIAKHISGVLDEQFGRLN